MVGEYVPEVFQPQAVHLSENKPPCIERSTGDDEQAGQRVGSVIVDVAKKETD